MFEKIDSFVQSIVDWIVHVIYFLFHVPISWQRYISMAILICCSVFKWAIRSPSKLTALGTVLEIGFALILLVTQHFAKNEDERWEQEQSGLRRPHIISFPIRISFLVCLLISIMLWKWTPLHHAWFIEFLMWVFYSYSHSTPQPPPAKQLQEADVSP